MLRYAANAVMLMRYPTLAIISPLGVFTHVPPTSILGIAETGRSPYRRDSHVFQRVCSLDYLL
jgi:hypothetical protein